MFTITSQTLYSLSIEIIWQTVTFKQDCKGFQPCSSSWEGVGIMVALCRPHWLPALLGVHPETRWDIKLGGWYRCSNPSFKVWWRQQLLKENVTNNCFKNIQLTRYYLLRYFALPECEVFIWLAERCNTEAKWQRLNIITCPNLEKRPSSVQSILSSREERAYVIIHGILIFVNSDQIILNKLQSLTPTLSNPYLS